ncbi:MAG: hypothetical protein N2047_03910 [Meiothermus sp.]|jgi:hypothetical protein|nr:hypothetical protein [Meiothermus sp.]GIW31445.1 MAG: hypothetical protein KatS3mg071_1619 [Meiothermus sp.]
MTRLILRYADLLLALMALYGLAAIFLFSVQAGVTVLALAVVGALLNGIYQAMQS